MTAEPITIEPTSPGTPVLAEQKESPPQEPTLLVTKIEKPSAFNGDHLPIQRGELFSGSGGCVICHNNMVDEAGEDVSIDRTWRSTMMANSARDPYWLASVKAEVISNPELQKVIEDKCATCHMSMARTEDAAHGIVGKIFDDGYLNPKHEYHPLAMDGVACNTCHQIRPENFGETDSFSGGFIIDHQTPMGERENFGPYEIEDKLAKMMKNASGFIPVEGEHMAQSELCGTCHNLYTPYLNVNDEIAGVFPEQTIYNEWLNSSFSNGKTCQGCHMPQAQGNVQISTTGGPPRSPFYEHLFVGGNTYMMQLFLIFGPQLGVTADSEHFVATLSNIEEQLRQRTAELMITDLRIDEQHLYGTIQLDNLVGHKLPTGFPSRRVWLHVTVRDENGEVIFESGSVNPDGSIDGNDNDKNPTQFESHYTLINSTDQVQIYESIMVNTEGELTTTLLRGASYIKDNRLPQQGFEKTEVEEDIVPYGEAMQDADFSGGGDALELNIDLGGALGPFKVTVELLYQSIGYRWAQNLQGIDAPEVERFMEYYQSVPNSPVVISRAEAVID